MIKIRPGVVLTNVQRIYGLTSGQKEEVRKSLTFDNPDYLKAERYSPWGKPPVRIPRFLEYYEDKGRFLEVPLHFKLPFSCVRLADFRVERQVKWPDFCLELREGQQQALDSYLANPDNGQVVLDTGEGKTILAYAIASTLGQKALVLVDRVSYMKPWFDDIEKAFGGSISKKDVGIIKANQFRVGEHVTVAFFQTLNNRDLTELSKEFGIIIHDESDTAAAKTRFRIIQSFKSKYRLAISGTVKRTDGLHFLHSYLYGDFAVNLQGKGTNILRDEQVEILRVETGFNCKVPRRYTKFTTYNSRGELEEVDSTVDHMALRKLEACDERSNKIKLHFIQKELSEGRSCLVLTHRVFHAVKLGLEIKKRGYKCRILFGGTPDELKEKIIDEAVLGKIDCIVTTFHYIKRGANVPRWQVGFAVTQTANETELRQAVGRIRRTFEEVYVSKKDVKKVTKKFCRWYDFTCMSIPPYRRQAMNRLELWARMKLKINYIKAPII